MIPCSDPGRNAITWEEKFKLDVDVDVYVDVYVMLSFKEDAAIENQKIS